MSKTIIMIVPMTGEASPFPDEYFTTRDVDCSSRESQERTVGKAMLDAVELAQSHPKHRQDADVHYMVMFAEVTERCDA